MRYAKPSTITRRFSALGIHSIVNVPLVSEGMCLGTLNISRAKAEWSKDEIALARALGLMALAAVLMLAKA